MRNGIVFMGALALTLSLGLAACGGSSSTAAPTPTTKAATPTATKAATTTPSGGATPTSSATGQVIQMTVTENPYSYSPTQLNLNVGQAYTLKFALANGSPPAEFHTFTVDELGIDIYINPGEPVSANITPSKAGTFQFYCTPHKDLGMKGTVTIS